MLNLLIQFDDPIERLLNGEPDPWLRLFEPRHVDSTIVRDAEGNVIDTIYWTHPHPHDGEEPEDRTVEVNPSEGTFASGPSLGTPFGDGDLTPGGYGELLGVADDAAELVDLESFVQEQGQRQGLSQAQIGERVARVRERCH